MRWILLLAGICAMTSGMVPQAPEEARDLHNYIGSADPQQVEEAFAEIVAPLLPPSIAEAAERGERQVVRQAILARVLATNWRQLVDDDADPLADLFWKLDEGWQDPGHPSRRLEELTFDFGRITGASIEDARSLIDAAEDQPKWQAALLKHLMTGQDDPDIFIWAIQRTERMEDVELRVGVVIRAIMSTRLMYTDVEFVTAKQYLSDAVARIAFADEAPPYVLWAYQFGADISEYTVVESFERGSERDREAFLDTLSHTLQREIEWTSPVDLLPHIREARHHERGKGVTTDF